MNENENNKILRIFQLHQNIVVGGVGVSNKKKYFSYLSVPWPKMKVNRLDSWIKEVN